MRGGRSIERKKENPMDEGVDEEDDEKTECDARNSFDDEPAFPDRGRRSAETVDREAKIDDDGWAKQEIGITMAAELPDPQNECEDQEHETNQ